MSDRRPSLRRRVGGAAVALALALAGAVEAADRADATLGRLAAAAGQGEPLLRIGLDTGHSITVSSGRPYRVVTLPDGKPVWHDRFEGPIRVVADGGPEGDVPSVYRVQVAAYSDRATAEAELERLSARHGVAGVVRQDVDRGTWRVRLGESADRLALGPLMERLSAAGMERLWIAEEPAERRDDVTLRLVDSSWESLASGERRLAVVPADGARIQVEGAPYRGIVELRVSPFGTVRAVNWVELEHYLLGVVPAELGPAVWPEIEALKAQAVAARTYVWRNRGQFDDEGFDLCATPRCQVYEGAAAEHPLSDRAVWATRGEVVMWNDRPIVALYTATCGGHTEDGGAIFAEHAEPYLSGVPCRAENDALASLKGTLTGRELAPVRDAAGFDVTRDAALLAASGVLGDETPATLDRVIDAATLRGATAALSRLAGRAVPRDAAGAAGTLAEAAASLVADVGWSDRARVLLDPADLPALLRDHDALALPEGQRRALGYLAWTEALRPHPDGRFRAGQPARTARLVPVLARVGESYDAFGLKSGVVAGVGRSSVRLVRGRGEVRLDLARGPRLFALIGGRPAPATRLELWPGDRIRYRTDPAGRIDFLEVAPPVKGTSDDRSAAVYAWEVRKSRAELESAVSRRVSVGRLRDLEIVRRGVSGRVVELRVVGSAGSTVVRGFDVRRLLDLREVLTTIEIQRDADGTIEAVVFAGKGWGHGVGLCQVGAYGMALRGAKYKEILGHYYRGGEIRKMGADDFRAAIGGP